VLIHTPHHLLPVNRDGRDFVVGDVHGHAALLDGLLAAVHFEPSRDRLIALGDLIDRGPDSLELLQRVATLPWFHSLRGNHEALLQDSMHDVTSALLWHRNGGQWGQALADAELRALARCVDGLPLAMTLPLRDGRRIGLVHAEVPIGAAWPDVEALNRDLPLAPRAAGLANATDAEALQDSLLWGRRRISACERLHRLLAPQTLTDTLQARLSRALQPVPGIDQIIAGHSYAHDRRPLACGNLLFIDTGVFEHDGRLTLFEPLRQHYWQARYGFDGRPQLLRHEGEPAPPAAWLPQLVA